MSSILTGKTAIVTGGARGIGFAIAQELIKEDAKVVICSRTKSDLQKALEDLNKITDTSIKKVAFGIVADVSKLSDCQKLIKFASRNFNKKIDILVNNAGIYGPIGPFEKIDLNHWKQTIDINLMGMVYCSYLTVPFMKKGGKIINLCGSGVGGSKTRPNFSAYFTSKSAVAGFTEVLAEELKEKNIQVNSISPGAVNTYLNEYLIKQGLKKSGKQFFEEALRQKKEGGTSPKLAAKLIIFLSSSHSKDISGRLLSAKWESSKKLKKLKLSNNLYKLRRIDQELFYEKG